MKNIFLILILFPGFLSAQSIYDKGRSDQNKFIEKSSIEWAVTADDTLLSTAPDLREMLINKALAGEIKLLPPPLGLTQPELNPDKAKEIIADANAKGLVNVRKILYLKNGRLLSYIYSVSPLVSVTTNSGMYLGRGELFTTAENSGNKTKFKKKDLVFITADKKEFYIDSVPKTERLKETFGRNLLETLWPYVLSGKIEVYNAVSKQKLSIEQIRSGNIFGSEVAIPVYDSAGNLKTTSPIYSILSPEFFGKITIIQKWFYNSKKNILINTIPEILLYKYDNTSYPLLPEKEPLLKLVF